MEIVWICLQKCPGTRFPSSFYFPVCSSAGGSGWRGLDLALVVELVEKWECPAKTKDFRQTFTGPILIEDSLKSWYEWLQLCIQGQRKKMIQSEFRSGGPVLNPCECKPICHSQALEPKRPILVALCCIKIWTSPL